MWVARVLWRSDEYMRRSTCREQGLELQEAVLPAAPVEKLANSLLLVAVCFSFALHAVQFP